MILQNKEKREKDFVFVENIINQVFHPVKNWNKTKSRKKQYVFPSQVANWILYYYSKHSLADIGFHFGRKASCTISHSIQTVNGLIESDYVFACNIRMIQLYLKDSGYKMIYPYGRSILESDSSNCIFKGIYAQPPKKREVVKELTLREKLIAERSSFVSSFDVLAHKKRKIKVVDVDQVGQLAKEIAELENK